MCHALFLKHGIYFSNQLLKSNDFINERYKSAINFYQKNNYDYSYLQPVILKKISFTFAALLKYFFFSNLFAVNNC